MSRFCPISLALSASFTCDNKDSMIIDIASISMITVVDGIIIVGANFRALNKNDSFVGFKIHGQSIFFHNSYRKLPFCGYWNSWIGPSTKIGTQRNLNHLQYIASTSMISRLI